jgi:hypothetical protein
MDMMKGTEAHQGGEVQMVEIPGKPQLLSGSATAKINGTTYLFAAQGGRGGGVTIAWKFGADRMLTEAWRNTSGGNTPFVAGGLVYTYDAAAAGGHVRVFDAATGTAVATLDCGGGHWNSVIVVDNRIALPEGAISGFGGGGGRGGGGRGGPPAAPGAPAAVPTPAPAPAAPPAPPAIPTGIVNIWRLP